MTRLRPQPTTQPADRERPLGGPRVPADRPPLTARSVVASVLLGTEPPVMSARALVRAGTLFGLADGTVRTALSRMVSNGELRSPSRRPLRARWAPRGPPGPPAGQPTSRVSAAGAGTGRCGSSGPAARSAAERAELRAAARVLRLAELRDGVWLRPDNLDRSPVPRRRRHDGRAGPALHHPARRTTAIWRTELWDLADWSDAALGLRREMAGLHRRLDSDDTDALAPGFVLAAAVLRHLNDDPAAARRSCCRATGRATACRADYEAYDDVLQRAAASLAARPVTGATPSRRPGCRR